MKNLILLFMIVLGLKSFGQEVFADTLYYDSTRIEMIHVISNGTGHIEYTKKADERIYFIDLSNVFKVVKSDGEIIINKNSPAFHSNRFRSFVPSIEIPNKRNGQIWVGTDLASTLLFQPYNTGVFNLSAQYFLNTSWSVGIRGQYGRPNRNNIYGVFPTEGFGLSFGYLKSTSSKVNGGFRAGVNYSSFDYNTYQQSYTVNYTEASWGSVNYNGKNYSYSSESERFLNKIGTESINHFDYYLGGDFNYLISDNLSASFFAGIKSSIHTYSYQFENIIQYEETQNFHDASHVYEGTEVNTYEGYINYGGGPYSRLAGMIRFTIHYHFLPSNKDE